MDMKHGQDLAIMMVDVISDVEEAALFHQDVARLMADRLNGISGGWQLASPPHWGLPGLQTVRPDTAGQGGQSGGRLGEQAEVHRHHRD